jgi:hypothetical protein
MFRLDSNLPWQGHLGDVNSSEAPFLLFMLELASADAWAFRDDAHKNYGNLKMCSVSPSFHLGKKDQPLELGVPGFPTDSQWTT